MLDDVSFEFLSAAYDGKIDKGMRRLKAVLLKIPHAEKTLVQRNRRGRLDKEFGMNNMRCGNNIPTYPAIPFVCGIHSLEPVVACSVYPRINSEAVNKIRTHEKRWQAILRSCD